MSLINQRIQMGRVELYVNKNINVSVQNRQGQNEIQIKSNVEQGGLFGYGGVERGVVCSGSLQKVRGKHERIFTTQSVKRKQLKCNKETQSIPMTLFYDADNKRFLQKILQIEATVRNDLQDVEMQLGSAQLNVINYLNHNKLQQLLQIKLYSEEQKQTTIKFTVLIEKQEDDNKSAKTNETYQSSENGDNVAANKKYYTANVPNYKVQTYSPSQNSSQKNWSVKSPKPPKYPSKQDKPNKLPKEQDVFSKKYEQSIENVNQDSQRTNKASTKREKTTSKRQKSTQKPKTSTNLKKKESSQQKQKQSQQLMLFICQKQLRQKQKMLQAAKRIIQAQNTIIAKYQEQKNKAYKSSQSLKYLSEIDSLKSQLLRANLKISELQTTNRNLQASEKQHIRLIDTKTKQASYYKEQLESTKIKIGNLMQRCFEAKEFDLMAVIEEELEDS